jgi:tetratricopeptide (TPR) repeat protein
MTPSPQTALTPAKIITPAIRQRLQERLNQARKLSVGHPCPRGQIDKLLCECVIVDPGNTVYIGALLHHLRRSDRPGGVGFQPAMTFLSRLFATDPLPAIRHAAANQNWDQVLTLAPPALCQQPQSVEILRHLATACAALEHEQAELCYLQSAIALAPADAETERQLARALTRQGLFDDAAIAWKRLAEMLPEDEECRQTIKILREYTPPEGITGLLADDEVREIQNAVDAGTATWEQVRRLFDHYRGWRRFDEAQRLLDSAMGLFGPSLMLFECREQLLMDRSTHSLFIATELAAFRGEYLPIADRAVNESVRTHLQVYYQRCERHPEDPELKLNLGRILSQSGNYSEAVKRLEEVAEIPRLRAKALYALGHAWEKLRQPGKAMSCYRESIELAIGERDETTASFSLQWATFLAQRQGNLELVRNFCGQALLLQSTDESVRSHQDWCRSMLDNLNCVCHNP